MAYQSLRDEYMRIPPVTRVYTTACVLTTLAVVSITWGWTMRTGMKRCVLLIFLQQLDLVTPFQLYFNPTLILKQGQVYRLLTTFLYFGTFGFNFFFNMVFTYRYCRMLEENSFRDRTADFVMMFLFGGVLMIVTFLSKIFK